MDGTHGKFSSGLDELGHRLSHSGEIPLVHLLRVIFQGFGGGADEADVGEGVDAEEVEGRLGFAELDVAEEELGIGAVVVGDERGGDEGELVPEFPEVELGFVVELGGVEEDDERVRARSFRGCQEFGDGPVV